MVMNGELKGTSKYQRKQLAKACGQWLPPSERVEVALSVKIKPPTQEVGDCALFADASNMVDDWAARRLCEILEHVAGSLRIAHRIAAKLNRDTRNGSVRSHTSAIMGRTAAFSQKIEGLVARAHKVEAAK